MGVGRRPCPVRLSRCALTPGAEQKSVQAQLGAERTDNSALVSEAVRLVPWLDPLSDIPLAVTADVPTDSCCRCSLAMLLTCLFLAASWDRTACHQKPSAPNAMVSLYLHQNFARD